MPKLVILGSGAALSDAHHQNTHMIVVGEERSFLIDCGVNPYNRLRDIGLNVDSPTDMLLTHFHPDHVAGTTTFLLSLWLAGRKKSLNIHGLRITLDKFRAMLDVFDWDTLPDFFSLNYLPIPPQEMIPVLECDEFRVFSSPVKHIIPTIGLRVEFVASGKVLAYSSDTEPRQEVVRLAQGADVLIHEAAGPHPFHSSAAQAGEIAKQAGTKELYLIHYPTFQFNPTVLVEEAEKTFRGPVYLAQDMMELEFS